MVERIEREVELPVGPAAAWSWVTGPRELGDWFDADVELDPRPHGLGRFRFPDGTERLAIVERITDEELLEFRWWPAGDHGAASRVAITLEPTRGGTLVRVVETRLRATAPKRGALLAGV
jgi:uncharacterized protein YndB with AHSA1/START domain